MSKFALMYLVSYRTLVSFILLLCLSYRGRSTLPCVKLRAVVDAAKEISQLDAEERSVFPDATFFDATVVTKVKALGADDFLPIFIYCFVQAKIERPSALCKLTDRLYLCHAHTYLVSNCNFLFAATCTRRTAFYIV